MTIFATSDIHAFHNNIIKYCNRPFSNALEMNEAIVKNWNSVVSSQDDVYFLGDFAFSKSYDDMLKFFNRLNGNKCLIKGNHDGHNALKLPWKYIRSYDEIEYKGYNFCLMHYPIEIWNRKHHGSIMLHGHCHTLVNKFEQRRMDVGVDANNFTPISFDDIIKQMQTIQIPNIERNSY